MTISRTVPVGAAAVTISVVVLVLGLRHPSHSSHRGVPVAAAHPGAAAAPARSREHAPAHATPAGDDGIIRHATGISGTASTRMANTGRAVDPVLFAPGACVEFRPARGDLGTSVFLDAGHGGQDPGGGGRTLTGAHISEAWVNLRVEMDAMKLLSARGYRVVVSRTRPDGMDLLRRGDVSGGALTVHASRADIAARDLCANMARASLLVGIYMNAGPPGAAGSVTGYDAARPFSASNLRLATMLQHDVLGALNGRGYAIPDGGVLADDHLGSAESAAGLSYGHLMLLGPPRRGYFQTPSRMPGALIEPLFLTDPYEATVAVSPAGQQLVAAGIAQAVCEYFTHPARDRSLRRQRAMP